MASPPTQMRFPHIASYLQSVSGNIEEDINISEVGRGWHLKWTPLLPCASCETESFFFFFDRDGDGSWCHWDSRWDQNLCKKYFFLRSGFGTLSAIRHEEHLEGTHKCYSITNIPIF